MDNGVRSPSHRSPEVSPPSKRRAQFSPDHRSGARRSLSGQFGVASRASPVTYSDRFVPSRAAADLAVEFQIASNALAREKERASPASGSAGTNGRDKDENSVPRSTYEAVLRSELFGGGGDGSLSASCSSSSLSSLSSAAGAGAPSSPPGAPSTPQHCRRGNLLQFSYDISSPSRGSPQLASPYSLSPLSDRSKELLMSPQKTPRKISKAPYKVLEAPAIQDDFYLNLIDWGAQNVLAVGLGSCVYLWNAQTAQVSKLTDVGISDLVSSVSWMACGSHIAIGTNSGGCYVWDAVADAEVRSLGCHKNRVGTLCWNGGILTSGSRDRFIYHHDMRSPKPYVAKLAGHKQEVCGLRWSPDGQYLASGGNDNRLLIWSPQSTVPIHKYNDHTAAVKAIAWSPHQRGLLASGGGTADRTIRFRNILTNSVLHSIDTGSQVCNLAWSKNVNELVSTHGYSQNQIIVWSYPSMTQLARLTGHMMRVLYLAVSPDGQTIVTGAGDETLRFWSAFPPSGSKETARSQIVSGSKIIIR